MMKYFLIAIACISIISCGGDKRPSGVLSPEKMQLVLWDYIRADAFTTDYLSKDSLKNLNVENVKMQKEIFARHKITEDIFYKSYAYYEAHPEEMRIMLDSMIARKRRIVFTPPVIIDTTKKPAD